MKKELYNSLICKNKKRCYISVILLNCNKGAALLCNGKVFALLFCI